MLHLRHLYSHEEIVIIGNGRSTYGDLLRSRFESSFELTGDKNNASTNETAKITDCHNFVVIRDQDVVWQKVYNSAVKTIHDLEGLFFGHGFTDC